MNRSSTPLVVVFGCVLSWGALAQLGCYKPSIADGSLTCSETGDACPSGFSCQAGRCYLPDSAMLNLTPEAGAPDACSSQPVPGCITQMTLVCDPVCQSGCCGANKCTTLNQRAAGDKLLGILGCSPATMKSEVGKTCTASHSGTLNRSDDCLPGLICIDGDSSLSFCFKLCRDDRDCDSGAKCEERQIDATPGSTATAKVCGLPNASCDPTAPKAVCQNSRTCYLTVSDAVAGDTTVCDIASGDLTNGECKTSRECLPLYTCPTGVSMCRLVCSLAPGATPCPPSTPTCQPGGKDYSYCN